MLHIIFVEAALETVPLGIASHPSVRRNAKRRGKRPEGTLLSRSLHHSVMDRLQDDHKRGRPDIINFCLLEALGSPLNRSGGLRTWVHTYGDFAIEVSPDARLPRDCNRFNSLMEQLFTHNRVPPDEEKALMTLKYASLSDIVGGINPTNTVALTSHGDPSDLETLCTRLVSEERPTVFIGAFPHGPMKPETLSLANETISIHSESLEAWIVTSRLIYDFERAMSNMGEFDYSSVSSFS